MNTSKPDTITSSRRKSNGFGRLLQTRNQLEDIIDDDSEFRDSGLPAGQFTAKQDGTGKKGYY